MKHKQNVSWKHIIIIALIIVLAIYLYAKLTGVLPE